MPVDVVAYDRLGRLRLIAEVTKKLGATADWAMQLRHNLAAHRSLPTSDFFLLALTDRFFLWTAPAP